jgi:hypothetical protein
LVRATFAPDASSQTYKPFATGLPLLSARFHVMQFDPL